MRVTLVLRLLCKRRFVVYVYNSPILCVTSAISVHECIKLLANVCHIHIIETQYRLCYYDVTRYIHTYDILCNCFSAKNTYQKSFSFFPIFLYLLNKFVIHVYIFLSFLNLLRCVTHHTTFGIIKITLVENSKESISRSPAHRYEFIMKNTSVREWRNFSKPLGIQYASFDD